MEQKWMNEELRRFQQYLRRDEKSTGTVQKYMRDVSEFMNWSGDRDLSKDVVLQWREALLAEELKPGTVNGKLASLNCYLKMKERSDCRVKALKVQRRMFRSEGRELTKSEYERLLAEAEAQGKERLKLIMETICATGIRVSEVGCITVEAIASRRTEIRLKGKVRGILIPTKLCRKLSKYVKKNAITTGEIFLSRSGKPLSRKRIWAEMKLICEKAGVEASKVFPHNLRHLFARCYYRVSRDLVQLADILGHSSVETTRIYLISTGEEHARTMERLRLIS